MVVRILSIRELGNSQVASWKTRCDCGGERLVSSSAPAATGLQAGPLQPRAPLCLSAARRRITTRAVHRVQMLSKGPGGGGRTMLQRLMKSWEPRCQIPAASRGRCLSASGPACLSSQVCSRPRGSQRAAGCGSFTHSVARRQDTCPRTFPADPGPPKWSVSPESRSNNRVGYNPVL